MADLFSRLPLEIQQIVFDILQEKGARILTPFLTVNKFWFALITRRLYREVQLRAICHLRHSPNAELYLSNVRSLTFGLGDQIYHPVIIQKWAKPPLYNLEKVSFRSGGESGGHDVDYIIPYLQPSISTVELFGARWTSDLLLALRETCKGLKELSIKYPFKGKSFSLDVQCFDDWLQAFPKLDSISVFDIDGIVNEEGPSNALTTMLFQATLRGLSNRGLRRLRLAHQLEDWKQLFNGATFNSLRELSIIVKPKDIAGLPILVDLRKLQILVDNEPHKEPQEIISPLCSMTALTSLRVIFAKSSRLHASEVMSLTHLINLEELEILSRHQEVIVIDNATGDEESRCTPLKILPSFDENDFDLLASSLRKLRHVCLLFDWMPDSTHVLKSAAYLWRRLEYLCLGYNLDLPESVLVLGNGYPLFPYMKELIAVRSCIGDLATDTEAMRDDRDAL